MTCNAGSDGSASVTVIGMDTNLTYNNSYVWTDNSGTVVGTTSSVSGLAAGTYTCIASDSVNGCSATIPVTISEPSPIAFTAIVTTSTTPTQANGSVDITIGGGTPCVTLTSGYCTTDVSGLASGPTSTGDSEIEAINITGDAGTSIAYAGGCTAPNTPVAGIRDNTSSVVDLSAGNTYSLDVDYGDCSGSVYDGWGEAWIDFNSDGVFDASELVGSSAANPGNVNAGPVTYTFTVPAGTLPGETRLRVTHQEGPSSGPLDPCARFTWGTTIDFGVRIDGGANPYTYAWSNGDTTQDADSLGIGPVAVTVTDCSGCTATWSGFIVATTVPGCTDPTAFNYNPVANIDDSSCIAVVIGCMDTTAFNYDTLANINDSTLCVPFVYGCTDPSMINYNSLANVDDSSCAMCTGLVVAPYIETFDSVGYLGSFNQSTTDQMNWTQDNLGTGSFQTGPSDDITGGGYYMYTETSGFNNLTAMLYSECIDISQLSCPSMRFSYHMYGATTVSYTHLTLPTKA